MFTSPVDSTSKVYFSDLGECNKFTSHQFHVKGWGARDFEGHAPGTIHNNTGRAVPLKWLLLYIQPTVDLIANENMLVNIKKARGKDTISIHCNSGAKIVDRVSELPSYGTVWYKPKGIANILSMSRATKKIRVVFDSEGGNIFRIVLPYREVIFQLIHNRLYYFDSKDREISVLILNTLSENRKWFTHRKYEGT